MNMKTNHPLISQKFIPFFRIRSCEPCESVDNETIAKAAHTSTGGNHSKITQAQRDDRKASRTSRAMSLE